MKEFSNKTPYLAPQLTVVEFQVERGYSESAYEISAGMVGKENDLHTLMVFGASQGQADNYMGNSGMDYFSGSGYFTSSGTGDGSGYFGE